MEDNERNRERNRDSVFTKQLFDQDMDFASERNREPRRSIIRDDDDDFVSKVNFTKTSTEPESYRDDIESDYSSEVKMILNDIIKNTQNGNTEARRKQWGYDAPKQKKQATNSNRPRTSSGTPKSEQQTRGNAARHTSQQKQNLPYEQQKRPQRPSQQTLNEKSRTEKNARDTKVNSQVQERTAQRPNQPRKNPNQNPGQNTRKNPNQNPRQNPRQNPSNKKSRKEKDDLGPRIERGKAQGNRKSANKPKANKPRRKRKKASEKSKLIMKVSIIIAAIIVAITISAYLLTIGIPVTRVEVIGQSEYYTSGEIVEMSNIKIDDNILTIGKKKVESEILKNLPYLKTATIVKNFNGTVNIEIVPTKEKYIIQNGFGTICVNDEDKIINTDKVDQLPNTYLLKGFDEEALEVGVEYKPSIENFDRFKIAKLIVERIESLNDDTAVQIDLSDLNDITIIYDSRITIYLGKADYLDNIIHAYEIINVNLTEGVAYINADFETNVSFKAGIMKRAEKT